jgi:hypothetical protein
MRTGSVVSAVVLVTLIGACSGPKDRMMRQLKEQMANSKSAGGAGAQGDACGLLDTTEVAAAIGPLASPPYHGTYRPDAESNVCRYDTKDHRRVLVTVDWSGGPQAMSMVHVGRGLTDGVSKQGEAKVGKTVLSSGDTLVGEWDEIAQGPMQCCDLHALRGDQHVELDWTGTQMAMPAAGALLNSAVKRLDHPLGINGAAGVPSAQQTFAADAKDSALDACTLVPQAAAEAILGGKLASPPGHGPPQQNGFGSKECIYRMPEVSGQPPREYDLILFSWRDGAVQFAEDQFVIGGAAHGMRKQLTGDTAAVAVDTTEYPVGPWDEAGPNTSVGFEAVKGPVMLRLAAMGDRKTTLALLAQAVKGLGGQH